MKFQPLVTDREALYISGNAQESFSQFHSTLLKLFNKHFPKQTVKQKYKTRKWWLSDSLKESIKTKNKLYVKWLKVNTTANEVTYKNYRNKLNHVLKYAERKHFQDILDKNKNDIKTRQIWGIWKLRPAYSSETPNLGQNRWCFVPCDLEIWWMTLENNRASLLCCFKLCATFHSHRWIQTGVTVRKRPIWVKFDNF